LLTELVAETRDCRGLAIDLEALAVSHRERGGQQLSAFDKAAV
jgi:hypothetical protein